MKRIIVGLFSGLIAIIVLYLGLALYLLSSSEEEALLAATTTASNIYTIPIIHVAQAYIKYSSAIDPNGEDELGMPYFHFVLAGYSRTDQALNSNIFKVADIFIEKGAKIDELTDKRNGLNALHSAILLRDFEAVKFLISRGADISVTTKKVHDPSIVTKTSNLNAIEFAELLYQLRIDKDERHDYKRILDYLKSL